MARRRPRNRRHGSQGRNIPGGFQGQSHNNKKHASNNHRDRLRQHNRGWTNPDRNHQRQNYNQGQNQRSQHHNRRQRGRQRRDQHRNHRFYHNTVDEEDDDEYRQGTDDPTTSDEETDYDGEGEDGDYGDYTVDEDDDVFSPRARQHPRHCQRQQNRNVFLRNENHRDGNYYGNDNYGRDVVMDPAAAAAAGTPQHHYQQQYHDPFAALLAAAGPPPPPRASKARGKKPCAACARARRANHRLRAAVERTLAHFGRAWIGWLRASGLPAAADAEPRAGACASAAAANATWGGGGDGDGAGRGGEEDERYRHDGRFRCCPDRMDWEPASTFVVIPVQQEVLPNPFAPGTGIFGAAGAGPGCGGLGGVGAGAAAGPVFANMNNYNGGSNNSYNPFANNNSNNIHNGDINRLAALNPADQRLVERLFGPHTGFAVGWHETHHLLTSQFPAAVQVLADAVRRGVTAQQLRGIVAFLVALYRQSANTNQGVDRSSTSTSSTSSNSTSSNSTSSSTRYSATATPRLEEPALGVLADQQREWYTPRQYTMASNTVPSWKMRSTPY